MDSRWWTSDAAGARVWLDELQQRWRPEGEEPRAFGTTWSVIVRDLGRAPPERVRRLVGEFTEHPPERVEPEGAPLVVCSGVGYATAEGLRQELERVGATCELRED